MRRKRRYGLADNLNVSKNVKDTFSSNNLKFYAEMIAVAAYSVIAPTLFKIKGWGAYALGYGVPFVAGMLFKRPAMVAASVAGASLHAMFWGGDEVLSKNPILNATSTWGISSPGLSGLSDDNQGVTGGGALPPGVQMVQFDNKLVAVEPRENLSNYISQDEEIGFSDYILSNEEVAFSGGNQDSINRTF